MSDSVNHPSHYVEGSSIECIDAMEIAFGTEAVLDYCILNAYKYLWRYKLKGKPDEDLAKARWYIDKAFMYNHGYDDIYEALETIDLVSTAIKRYTFKEEDHTDPDLKIPEDLQVSTKIDKVGFICPHCKSLVDRFPVRDMFKKVTKCPNCSHYVKPKLQDVTVNGGLSRLGDPYGL